MNFKSYFFAVLMIFSFAKGFAQAAKSGLSTSINHISLFVVDMEKSASFYEKIVLLKRIEDPFKDGKHVWLRIGNNQELHISPGASSVGNHPKSLHLAFTVSSLEDFIDHLDKNNIKYSNWPGTSKAPNTRPDGVKQVYFQDPDGYWVEINDAGK